MIVDHSSVLDYFIIVALGFFMSGFIAATALFVRLSEIFSLEA